MLVVKLGGSVIQENLTEINPKIYDLIDKLVGFDEKIVISIGGGKVCRLYQNPLKDRGKAPIDHIHRIGTRAINLQADFVRCLFPPEETLPFLVDSGETLQKAVNLKDEFKFFTRGAWIVGRSSDYEAADIGVHFGGNKILRISNVDYVYDADPRKNPDANPLLNISWNEYLEVIGNPEKHEPGASYPVDPIAAKFAIENKLTFYFTSLNKFLDLEKLDFDKFDGTVIH